MKTIYSILFLLFLSPSFSQDYGKEIEGILRSFEDLKSYEIQAKVTISGDEAYAFDASIKSSKYGSWVRADISEMLMNDKYAIAIDHEDKTVRIDKGDYHIKTKGNRDDSGLELLSDMMNEEAGVEYIGQADGYKTYVIYPSGSITKTVVKIDVKTSFFKEIEVFYESDEISISSYKVVYTKFRKNPPLKASDFLESDVFTKNAAGKLVLNAKYKGYTIIR